MLSEEVSRDLKALEQLLDQSADLLVNQRAIAEATQGDIRGLLDVARCIGAARLQELRGVVSIAKLRATQIAWLDIPHGRLRTLVAALVARLDAIEEHTKLLSYPEPEQEISIGIGGSLPRSLARAQLEEIASKLAEAGAECARLQEAGERSAGSEYERTLVAFAYEKISAHVRVAQVLARDEAVDSEGLISAVGAVIRVTTSLWNTVSPDDDIDLSPISVEISVIARSLMMIASNLAASRDRLIALLQRRLVERSAVLSERSLREGSVVAAGVGQTSRLTGRGSARMGGDLEEFWGAVSNRLRIAAGPRRILESLRILSKHGDRVVISGPSRFDRDRVVEIYGDRIVALIQEIDPSVMYVDFVVDTRPHAVQPRQAANVRPAANDRLSAQPAEPVLVAGSIALNKNFTFETYVTGKSNQIAFNEAKRAADVEQPIANPLFLFGPTGLGKTHLMHAIAWRKLQHSPNLRVLFITAETFMRLFVMALKANDTVSFKNQVRNVDLLLVDDLHFILGKEATQEELFAMLVWLNDDQKQIVLSADRSPPRFEGLSERARSFLLKGVSSEITPTDFELRLAILETKTKQIALERPGFTLNTQAAHFMAQRIATNTRELEGALSRIVLQSEGVPITIENLNHWLADFLRAYDRGVTIDEIKKKVAEHYGLKTTDLDSPSRSRSIVRPRQIAIYLSRLLTSRSFPEIGRRFGNRGHTSILQACETVQRLSQADPAFADEVDQLRLAIRSWPELSEAEADGNERQADTLRNELGDDC